MSTKRTETGYQYNNVVVDTKDTISPRCAQALTLAASGMPTRQIAEEMNISYGTTRQTLMRLYYQLNVYTLAQAIHKAASSGMLKYLSAVFLVLFSYMSNDQPIRNQTARVRIGSRHVRNNKNKRRNQNINFIV